jgi:hypothetical protein
MGGGGACPAFKGAWAAVEVAGSFTCGCGPRPEGPPRSTALGVVAGVTVPGLLPVVVVAAPGLPPAGAAVAVPVPGLVVALLAPGLAPGAVVAVFGLGPVVVVLGVVVAAPVLLPGVVVAVPVPGVVGVLTVWPFGCMAATGGPGCAPTTSEPLNCPALLVAATVGWP